MFQKHSWKHLEEKAAAVTTVVVQIVSVSENPYFQHQRRVAFSQHAEHLS